MDLVIAVLSGFVLAILAPSLHRVLGRGLGYAAALLPLGLTVYFARFIPEIGAREAVVERAAWVPEIGLSLSLRLDGLGLLFALLITGMGTIVCVYAAGYLGNHRQLGRFYAYLLAFMGAMLGLVLAGNLLALYVFWELTTLTSYLLVGFEHERDSARAAAQQALLTTALGGLAMLAGFVLLGLTGGSFEITDLRERADAVRDHALYLPALLLVLLGAFTKSAQFPFHYWLPGAMAAPTPLSAYLHSATMVKAGVYLLARLLPVLGGTTSWAVLVTGAGAATMLAGAALALREHDLKAILAYLTVNVLGTLVMLLGVGTPEAVKAALTYLAAHALYKGALFLVAGAVDHSAHTRDVRELGGLWRRMPLTSAAAVLAMLSMAGVAPMFGFVAKELYLEAVWHAPAAAWWLTAASVVSSVLLVAGAGLVVVRPFFGHRSEAADAAHEAGPSLWLGPALLAGTGFVVGIGSQTLATPLLRPAASAALGSSVDMKLALWHGWTVPLALSLTALAGGAALYLARDRVLRSLPATTWEERWGPAAWYDRSLAGMNWVARRQTDLLQNGYLRWYVIMILGSTVLLVGLMVVHVGLNVRSQGVGVRVHEGLAVGLILAATAVAVRSESRFRAIASLGVVGFAVAWLFHLFGAPDLAMTQLVVESLTVVMFVLAFHHLPKFSLLSDRRTRARDAALALSAGAVMTVLLLLVTSFTRYPPVSDYFAEASYPLAHGRNVVNVILVDFRALDTLGEITVLSTAAVGVFALLRASSGGGRP